MGYASKPCPGELIAVLVVGLLHVVTEIRFSERAAMAYNAVVAMGFAVYLVWRARRSRGALRAWGMRTDNFRQAMLVQGGFALVVAAMLVAYGLASDSLVLPKTFWLTIVLYPVWGVGQQFALQNLVARNLTGLIPGTVPLAVVAAGLFSIAHYPRLDLVLLTLAAGLFLTLIYRRYPNLWAVGIVHGVLGSLAFYLLLREDPLSVLGEIFSGG